MGFEPEGGGGGVATNAPDWVYAQKFPFYADPTGATDSTTKINNAIITANNNQIGVVDLGPGSFKLTGALRLLTQVIVQGNGNAQSFSKGAIGGPTILVQSNTSAHGFYQNDATQTGIRHLGIIGPGSGTGDGIHFQWTTFGNVYQCDLMNVQVTSFGGNGLYAQTLLGTTARMVECMFNGGDGFHLVQTCTSDVFDSCSAGGNSGWGWYVNGCNYLTFNGCAADGNANGWYFTNSQAISINGSGTENNVTDGLVLDGGGPYIVNGFWVSNNHYGVHVTAAATSAILNGIFEVNLGSAVYSIFAESGSKTVVSECSLQTASSLPDTPGFAYAISLQDGVVTANGMETEAFSPFGINGANQASRYVGGTNFGEPGGYGGPWDIRDFAADVGYLWSCTVAGTSAAVWVPVGSLLPQATKTANYALTPADSTILLNGTTLTATLPDAVANFWKIYTIKLIAASTTATVATTSSQTIDGATTFSLTAQYKSVTVQSDGANWYITGTH